MATFADIGNEYAEYLENNIINKDQAIAEVVRKINGLTYTKNNQSLSREDKLKIVDQIEYYLKSKKVKDGYLIVESSDSSTYIELIKMLRSKVNK